MMAKLRYIMVVVAILCAAPLFAQEVISDELIYDRVSGYMVDAESYNIVPERPMKNIHEIRHRHTLRLSYGAPSLFSEYMLGNVAVVCDCAIYQNYPNTIELMRHSTSPMRQLSTLSLQYAYCIKPGFWLGAKGAFAGVWQYEYDTITGERLYENNIYNVAAMLDAQIAWLRRDIVEMYSSLSVGLMAHIERANGGLIPMFDAVFVGLSVGRKVYGYVEIGAGIGGSVRGGIGIRFNSNK